ncbi:hypothetical protein GWK47_047984 [Chionoecetes opilio]|uniref:Uncharacterized protein n=1 Tax=Chionoecetes opilio TaxID=41210 RepID=A0A8J4Y509_CHIOP|nr:hypothetical protein GWK47_047984 [Chionoecetes opilio]
MPLTPPRVMPPKVMPPTPPQTRRNPQTTPSPHTGRKVRRHAPRRLRCLAPPRCRARRQGHPCRRQPPQLAARGLELGDEMQGQEAQEGMPEDVMEPPPAPKKKPQFFVHWNRRKPRFYDYNWDYGDNYYSNLVKYMDNRSGNMPRRMAFAERGIRSNVARRATPDIRTAALLDDVRKSIRNFELSQKTYMKGGRRHHQGRGRRHKGPPPPAGHGHPRLASLHQALPLRVRGGGASRPRPPSPAGLAASPPRPPPAPPEGAARGEARTPPDQRPRPAAVRGSCVSGRPAPAPPCPRPARPSSHLVKAPRCRPSRHRHHHSAMCVVTLTTSSRSNLPNHRLASPPHPHKNQL